MAVEEIKYDPLDILAPLHVCHVLEFINEQNVNIEHSKSPKIFGGIPVFN